MWESRARPCRRATGLSFVAACAACGGSSDTASPPSDAGSVGVDTSAGDGVMVTIPDTTFTMGCSMSDDPDCMADEQPPHQVHVSAFQLDVTEVTEADLNECYDAGACNSHVNTVTPGIPVSSISWVEANLYCTYRGGRLPTEAEWEAAARTGAQERIYPWGSAAPTCALANFISCVGDAGYATVLPVGSFPDGATPAGLLDMAGNLAELVYDRYDPNYYAASPTDNPTGPIDDAGTLDVVVRGGSFIGSPVTLRTTYREHFTQLTGLEYVGFRCAQ